MKKLFLIVTAVLTVAASADAKWWIFGKSADEVGLKYLYVNQVSSEEAGPKIKIFTETLGSDGLIKINGKASTGKGGVGSVRISLDDKAAWQDVKFAENGTFEYSFKPEQGKTYTMLLEVTDTAGKTNKVDDTRKEITLSDESIQAKVKETLDAMFAAYSSENLQKFMGYVGENFAGDKGILERAVKRDFDALSSINLRYTLNNISAGAQGRVFVSVTYSRMVFVNKSGATSQDTGSTEFVFDSNEGKLSLFSMKQPLMFGLSDAENVATGTTLGNKKTLTLDDSGSLSTGEVRTGSAVMNNHYTGCPGSCVFADADTFTFAAESVETVTSIGSFSGDFVFNSGVMFMNTGGEIKDLGTVSLDSVKQVTDSGWEAGHHIAPNDGHTYAMKLPGGKYALVYITNYDTSSAAALYVLHFTYNYQAGGGGNF